MDTTLPVVPVAILILGSYLIPLLKGFGVRPQGIAVACMGGSLSLVLIMLNQAARGTVIRYHVGGWAPPMGIEIRVGFLEAFLMATVTSIGLLIVVWSLRGLGGEVNHTAVPGYYTILLLVMSGMLGMIMAADLFNMYVFIEVTGLSACALAAARSDRRGTLAAFKYLALATIGSGFILFAIGLIYMVTGNLNLAYVSRELLSGWAHYPQLLWVAVCFLVVGFGIKAALFPLHVWLPDAHSSAPSPSSAVLSGLVVKVYAFALIKILGVVLVGEGMAVSWGAIRVVILVMSAGAILGGSAFALVQTGVKRLLAYSTVAQMGYVFLGVGLGTPAALTAAMFHLMAHAVMKSCLFLAAGTVAQRTGVRNVADYDGMGRRMPLTMAAFSMAALSMMGMPGFVGLISKWYLAVGAMEAGLPIYAVLMVVSGVLNACYYLPIIERAYFRPGTGGAPPGEGPVLTLIPIAVLAAGCVVLGIMPRLPLDLISRAMGF